MPIQPHQVNLIRKAAVLLENDHLEVARDLMQLAHDERPKGLFIAKKLNEYNNLLKPLSENEQKLKKLIAEGELAIIPTGFRCHTKLNLFDDLRLSQATMPFDNGFFPPHSIANILENEEIDLHFPDPNGTHKVCIKQEGFEDDRLGKGIRFQSAEYAEINALAADKNHPDINSYLDSTYGYYTLDVKNKYVLAHYNWHQFASEKHTKGVYDTAANIAKINGMMNKRIRKMIDLCQAAKYAVFVVGEFQGFEYMMIDDIAYSLNDFDRLTSVINDKFQSQCFIKKYPEIETADKMLNQLGLA